MNSQFYKYLNDVLWWCPFKKLRYLIREYLKKIEEIDKENKQIINHLNIITNKIFPENKNIAVIAVDGGFTDQIRIYLVAKSLEKFYNKKIFFDTSWYETNGMDLIKENKRRFEFTNVFKDLEFNIATKEQIFLAEKSNYLDFWKKVNTEERLNSLIKDDFASDKISYFSGVMSLSLKYNSLNKVKVNIQDVFKRLDYKDIIPSLDKYFLPILDEKNKEIYNDIVNSENTIACHIRRTDYVGFYGYADTDIDYYEKAFKTIENKVINKIKIFFFSDDLNWVKENIIPSIENKYDYKIVDINNNENGHFDFYLISKCNYQVASSGHFCKVAYEFNEFKNKILIIPENTTLM